MTHANYGFLRSVALKEEHQFDNTTQTDVTTRKYGWYDYKQI